MALDLEEQEQLDELKVWWKQNGTKFVAGVLIIALAIAGWNGWRWYQARQNSEAAALYEVLRQPGTSNDLKKVREISGQLIEKYAGTVYAVDAAMSVAKANFDAGDRKSAKAQYEWIIKHAKQPQSRELARLRLAAVLIDDKQFDEALKTLDGKHDPAFDAMYSDMRGDVYSLQGKEADARKAYQAALDKLPDASAFKGYVQIKLDALGEPG